MPALSIIVPIYNSSATLGACLDSILAQDYGDFELILVDDGSTDASPQICSEYQSGDGRIRYLRQENGGLSAARNAGLGIATGDYVSFVDSDDEVAREFYTAAFHGLGANGFDLFLVGMDRFQAEIASPGEAQVPVSENEFLELFLTTNYVGLSVCNKIFDLSLIKNNSLEFRNVRFAEDLVFVSEFKPFARKIIFDNRPLYHYRETPGSMTNKAKTSRVVEDRDFEILDALERVRPLYQSSANPVALSCFHVRLARSSLRLLMLMWKARAYRVDALRMLHANIRTGFRDFLGARYQRPGLKLLMACAYVLPWSWWDIILRRRAAHRGR
jgi:glycosyltransferase involved in cell wall biosynthesis